MNLRLLRGSILEELGRICHITCRLNRMLMETERAVGLHGALASMAESEARQNEELGQLFARFETVVPENPGAAVSGLFAEMEEDLCRQSGMYPPAVLDFRLLADLGRIVHYKCAALRSALTIARLMGAHEIVEKLEGFLSDESVNSRRLAELAGDVLHQCGADSEEEISRVLAIG